MNSFMLFRSHVHQKQHLYNIRKGDFNGHVAELWREMSEEGKEPWKRLAKQRREECLELDPNYLLTTGKKARKAGVSGVKGSEASTSKRKGKPQRTENMTSHAHNATPDSVLYVEPQKGVCSSLFGQGPLYTQFQVLREPENALVVSDFDGCSDEDDIMITTASSTSPERDDVFQYMSLLVSEEQSNSGINMDNDLDFNLADGEVIRPISPYEIESRPSDAIEVLYVPMDDYVNSAFRT